MSSVSSAWWSRVLTDGAGRIKNERGDTAEHYLLLPGAGDPRVVVDADSGPALDEALHRFARTRSLPPALGRVVSAIGPSVLRHREGWTVDGVHGSTLRGALCEMLGLDVRLSIAVGPPRPNRKPVVRCWHGADLVAVAKIGPDPHTAAMVRNESAWLRRLQTRPTRGPVVPELLATRTWGDGELIVMSVLPLVDDAPTALEEMPTVALRELIDRADDGADVAWGLGESAWWSSLLVRLSGHDDPLVAESISRAQDDPVAPEIELATWHGDWSPWNVGRVESGAWAIWDWERAATSAPSGFDLLHLHHQYGAGLWSADDAVRAVGIPDEHILLLRRLYLLELAARHHEAEATDSPRHRRDRQLLLGDADGSASAELRRPGVHE